MGEGDSNVTGNTTGNIINAIRRYAAARDQSRPTEDTENAGRQGRIRADAPYLLRTKTSGLRNAEATVIKHDGSFDGGLQSKSA